MKNAIPVNQAEIPANTRKGRGRPQTGTIGATSETTVKPLQYATNEERVRFYRDMRTCREVEQQWLAITGCRCG